MESRHEGQIDKQGCIGEKGVTEYMLTTCTQWPLWSEGMEQKRLILPKLKV